MPGRSLDFQLGQNAVAIKNPTGWPTATVCGDNSTPGYIHIPGAAVGRQWIFPFAYGFAVPISPPSLAPITVTTKDTPAGFPAAPAFTALASISLLEDAVPYSPGTRPSSTLGWTSVGQKTLLNGSPDSIITQPVPPTTRSMILVTGNGAGVLTGAGLFFQGNTTLTLYSLSPGGAGGPLAGVYILPANGQADSQYTFRFSDGGGFTCSVYASDAQAPGISQGRQTMAYSIPVVIASDQGSFPGLTTVPLPGGAEGVAGQAVAQAFRKATYTVDANAIATGALVAATDKFLLSLEHAAGGSKTVRIKRIVLNAVITAAGAAAGGLKFYIYTGTAASTGGTVVSSRNNNQNIGGADADTVIKTLPTIVAATGPKCVHGTWAPAAAGPLSETSDIVLYQWNAPDTEELALNAGVLQSIVVACQAVSTPNLTVYISVEYTLEG